MKNDAQLSFSQHFGRRIKDASRAFDSLGKILSEAIWNSIDNPNTAQKGVKVLVSVRPDGFDVEDDARGMDNGDFNNKLLYMDAENHAKEEGKRSKFGTGIKGGACAASRKTIFRSCKNGFEYGFEVDWDAVVSSSKPYVPVAFKPKPTTKPNGTIIEFRDLKKKTGNLEAAKNYLRKSLRYSLEKNEILISENGAPPERLVYSEPQTTRSFRVFPAPSNVLKLTGAKEIKIGIAEQPLEFHGIDIIVGGVCQEAEFTGKHVFRPAVKYLFGKVDAPLLNLPDEEGNEAYSSHREARLLRENKRVKTLVLWLEQCIGQVVSELEEEIQLKDKDIEDATADTRQKMKEIADQLIKNMLLAGTGEGEINPTEGEDVEVLVRDPKGKLEMDVLGRLRLKGDGEWQGPGGKGLGGLPHKVKASLRRMKLRKSGIKFEMHDGKPKSHIAFYDNKGTIYCNANCPEMSTAGGASLPLYQKTMVQICARELAKVLAVDPDHEDAATVDMDDPNDLIEHLRRTEIKVMLAYEPLLKAYGAACTIPFALADADMDV